MERRKFVIGVGSIAAGGAAAMGTGAFTSAQASRDVDIQVEGDGSAYVGVGRTGHPNGRYLDYNNGEAALNVDDSGNGGSGVNSDAHTRLNNVFRIRNQGTQTVYATIALRGNGDRDNIYFYDSDNETKALSPDVGNPGAYSDQFEPDSVGPDPSNIVFSAAELSPGESVYVGIDIEKGKNLQTALAGAENLQIQAFADLGDSPASNSH
ncbi:hypothetical protein [Halobaculum sp. EA56]|uniref:hypothetical protein n=1 Tax=Halobaculum sp. EA56 TaxID=3421648 RepID=UPI003EB8118F